MEAEGQPALGGLEEREVRADRRVMAKYFAHN